MEWQTNSFTKLANGRCRRPLANLLFQALLFNLLFALEAFGFFTFATDLFHKLSLVFFLSLTFFFVTLPLQLHTFFVLIDFLLLQFAFSFPRCHGLELFPSETLLLLRLGALNRLVDFLQCAVGLFSLVQNGLFGLL